MDLTPNDVRNYEFPTQLRGYDKDEVESFKNQVADLLETLKQEKLKLSMELESTASQLQGLRQFEETIKSAAIDARRNADMTIANAKKEAELLMTRARAEVEKVIAEHGRQIREIESQVSRMKLARSSYLAKLRQLITNHLELIEEIASSETPGGEKLDDLDITESTEVRNRRRETVATQPAPEVPIKTEEVKAAEEIIVAGEQAEPESAEPPEASTAETEPAEPDRPQDDTVAQAEAEAPAAEEAVPEASPRPIDPELAAALESYQKGVREEGDGPEGEATPPVPPAPPADEIVVTTARAEDVPEGFITRDDDSPEEDTDKVEVPPEAAPEAQDTPTEHNAVDMDNGEPPPERTPSMDSSALANELDQVVAKFEEEMDKAEKN
jgi:cell division initiation protein